MTALLILWKAKAPTPQNVAMPSAPSFAGKPATGHVQKRNETYCGIDSHRFTRGWVSPGTIQESCQFGSPSVHIWYHSSAVGRRERNWGGCCVTSHCTLLSLLVVCLKDPKPFSTEKTNHILHVGSATFGWGHCAGFGWQTGWSPASSKGRWRLNWNKCRLQLISRV